VLAKVGVQRKEEMAVELKAGMTVVQVALEQEDLAQRKGE
jgi:hypothetical protein